MTITTQSFTAINVGTTANDGQGDDLRTAFIKVNNNFQYMGNTGFNAGNIVAAGTVQAAYFVGDGSLLTNIAGGGGGGSNYSNANVASYLPTYSGNVSALYYIGSGQFLTGLPASYSNVNVASYLNTQGYNLYSNVNVAAYLNNNGTVPIGTTSTIYANATTQATSTGTGALVVKGGVGIAGNLVVGNLTVLGTQTIVSATALAIGNSFVFLANNNVTNVSDIGFVGQYNAGQGNVYTGLTYTAADSIYRLFSNLTPQPSITVNLANAIYSNIQVGNIIAGNVIGVNFIGSGAYLTSLPGYAYGNVNVAALITTNGLTNYSNVNTAAYLNSQGYNLYSNVNVAAYLSTQGIGASNYSNTNVIAYLNATGYNLYSNTNVIAYLNSTGYNLYSNTNVIAYLNATGYNLYSNVNVAAYLNNNGAVPIGTTSTIYANAGTQSTSTGTGALVVNGGAGISGNLTVGNLTVLGTQTTVSATSVNLSNSFIFLSNNNITNAVDIGFVGQYNAGQGNVYTGLAYRAADGIYRLFSNVSPQPSLTVNLASAIYSAIQVGNIIAANVTVNTIIGSNVYVNGNITASTHYGNVQGFTANITSNLTIGNSIITYAGSGANINIDPDGNGDVVLTNNTSLWLLDTSPSTNTTTGSLINYGGAGIAGNLNLGTVGAVSGAFHTVVGNITQVTSGGANVYFNTTGNISASFGNFGSGNVGGFAIGYRDVPQITAANVTLIASDAGKHYYGSNTNPVTLTIPLNSSVAFGNGTAISIVNQGTGNITIANVAGVQLYLAGNATAGSRTITTYGMATLIKVQINTWFINGTGVV